MKVRGRLVPLDDPLDGVFGLVALGLEGLFEDSGDLGRAVTELPLLAGVFFATDFLSNLTIETPLLGIAGVRTRTALIKVAWTIQACLKPEETIWR